MEAILDVATSYFSMVRVECNALLTLINKKNDPFID